MELVRFAKLFDHSIVRPDAIRLAAGRLRGSGVLVGTVVGFPHGNETPSMKVYQATEVLGLGADEIDMVMNIPAHRELLSDTGGEATGL